MGDGGFMRIPVLLIAVLAGCTTTTGTTAPSTTAAVAPSAVVLVASTSTPSVSPAVTVAGKTVTMVSTSPMTIDNFGDGYRAQVTAVVMKDDAGFRACAIDPIGCDRTYLDDTSIPAAKARTIASFEKRIVDKIRRRPNPNPDLDYTVIEKVEFPDDFDHAAVSICYVDGSARIYIGDSPGDVGVLNDDLDGSRGVATFVLTDGGKWKFADYTQTEVFEIGKPKCPPRPAV